MFDTITDEYQLQLAEDIALASAALVTILTFIYVGFGAGVEANPIADWLITTVGWYGFAAVRLSAVGVGFTLAHVYYARDDSRLALAFAWLWSATMTANLIHDLSWATYGGFPEELPFGETAVFIGLVSVFVGAWTSRNVPRPSVSDLPRPNGRQLRAIAFSAVLVISIVPSGAVATSGQSKTSAVDSPSFSSLDFASAATVNETKDWNDSIPDGSNGVFQPNFTSDVFVVDDYDGSSDYVRRYYENGTLIYEQSPGIARDYDVANENIFAMDGNGNLVAYDAADPTGAATDWSITITDDTKFDFIEYSEIYNIVYYGVGGNGVTAVDADTGDQLWNANYPNSETGFGGTNSTDINPTTGNLFVATDSGPEYVGRYDDTGLVAEHQFSSDDANSDNWDLVVNPNGHVLTSTEGTYSNIWRMPLDISTSETFNNPASDSWGPGFWDSETQQFYLSYDGATHEYDTSTMSASDNVSVDSTEMSFRYSEARSFETTSTTFTAYNTFDRALTQFVSGQATTTEGDPVENATVRITGVNYDNIEPAASQTLEERANELIDEAENPLPPEFDRTLDVQSTYLDDAEANVPLAYTREDIGAAPWTDSADLQPPNVVVPADEPVVFVECNPAGDRGVIKNEYQSQLPCTYPDDGPVVIEQLGPDGSVTQTTTVEIDETAGGGFGDPSSLDYGETRLSPGVYRISVQDSDASYEIGVGNPNQLASAIEDDLRNEADSLTQRAQSIRDRFQNNKFTATTVETNATGHYSAEVGSNVNTVAVEAYKAPDIPLNVSSDTHPRAQIRKHVDTYTYNGTIYLPSQPRRYDAPTQNADLQLREVSHTPYENITGLQDRLGQLQNLLENQTQRMNGLLQQPNATREDLEETYRTLRNVSRNNDATFDRADELLTDAVGEDAALDENASDLSESELRTRITVLEQALQEQRNTISSETTTSVNNDTVDAVAKFAGELTADEVDVVAHYANGTSRPVNDSYISVDRSTTTALPGQGSTEVSIEEFPLGDATAVQFEWVAARDNGVATVRDRVGNPTINADAPAIDSVRVSSLAPGPDEHVALELNPSEDSDYRKLVEATVYAPNGTAIPTDAIDNGDETGFETAGAGTYTAQLTYESVDGHNFTKTIKVQADSQDRNRKPSVRAESGPTGVYALVGDGLQNGGVSVGSDGDLSVAATVAGDADAPSEVHVYTGDLQRQPEGDITVRLLQGEDGEALDTRAWVYVHEQATPQDGTYVYRNGRPVTPDGNQYGEVRHMSNQTLIKTYTGADGAVEVTVNQPQGVIDSTIEGVTYNVKKIEVFGYSPLQIFGGGVPLIGLGLFARRRRGDFS
jgi:hypothetical protein